MFSLSLFLWRFLAFLKNIKKVVVYVHDLSNENFIKRHRMIGYIITKGNNNVRSIYVPSHKITLPYPSNVRAGFEATSGLEFFSYVTKDRKHFSALNEVYDDNVNRLSVVDEKLEEFLHSEMLKSSKTWWGRSQFFQQTLYFGGFMVGIMLIAVVGYLIFKEGNTTNQLVANAIKSLNNITCVVKQLPPI